MVSLRVAALQLGILWLLLMARLLSTSAFLMDEECLRSSNHTRAFL